MQGSGLKSNKIVNEHQYNQNQLGSNDLPTETRNDTTARDSWLDVVDLINVLKITTSTSHLQFDEAHGKESELLRKLSQIAPNTSGL